MSHLIISGIKSTVVKFSDEYLLNIWNGECAKHSKPLTPEAIRAIISLNYDFPSENTFGSNVANELSTPWEYCNDAAAIWPEDFPSWESEDSCLADWDSGQLLLTWHGKILADKVKKILDSRFKLIKNKAISSSGAFAPQHYF